VVGVTGMVVQAERMCEILRQLRTLPALVAVGGPFVTVNEGTFETLCDVRFIGEAEETWPAFLNALASGAPTEARYQQAEKTDMTLVPVPRFDLLKPGRYGTAPVQFSRGCPFLCEFCDIITIFRRRPRVKRPEQVLAELDSVKRDRQPIDQFTDAASDHTAVRAVARRRPPRFLGPGTHLHSKADDSRATQGRFSRTLESGLRCRGLFRPCLRGSGRLCRSSSIQRAKYT